MLYRPEDFEPVTEAAWDEDGVRTVIARIVADADEAYRRQPLWPPPPDSPVASGRPEPSLYAGAPGVVWALDALARRSHAETTLDPAAVALEALEAWRASPVVFPGLDDLPRRESSLLAGQAGVLLVAWLLTGEPRLADDLHELVRANVGADEIDELMWGTAGTLLAAATLRDRTGEARWRDACRDSAAALLARRDADGLWTQRRFRNSRNLGPVHGLVGNVRALLTTLEGEQAASLQAETNDAPGIVATSAAYLDEELLLAGAELAWRAGAHGEGKGAGICHGTAGNGYALLATFALTGDELWLDRARRFAVHALAQAEREPPVYSLWLGGIGVALFASDCLDATSRYPFLEHASAA